MVDEQFAVEVIHLMLQANRKRFLRLDLPRFAMFVEIAHAHFGGALDLGEIFREGEAALFIDMAFGRGP